MDVILNPSAPGNKATNSITWVEETASHGKNREAKSILATSPFVYIHFRDAIGAEGILAV